MQRLRSVELYRDEQRKVMAIESVELRQAKFSKGAQLNGSIMPVAIVVCKLEGKEVLICEDDTNLETLKHAYPELDKLIANICYRENVAG